MDAYGHVKIESLHANRVKGAQIYKFYTLDSSRIEFRVAACMQLGDSEERLDESSREPPIFPPLSDDEWGPVSSRVDSASWRSDSIMEGLGELFIQLGESKAIFLARRTTRRVVHMTRRVG